MRLHKFSLVLALSIVSVLCDASLHTAFARGGFKGGGGGARAGGGGGMSRPASMPHMGGGGGGSRPSLPASRPTMPSARPNLPTARPNLPQTRPSLPNQPAARPNLPQTRPNLPNPAVRPGGGVNISGGLKPSVKPGNRPNTLPGSLPGQPNVNRPNIDRPNINRPNLDRPGSSVGNRPGLPNLGNGGGRPSKLPGNAGNANRPSPGDLGDFLGIPGGLKPGNTTRPNLPNRPSTLPARPNGPNLSNRPQLPNGLTPGMQGRPNLNNRPINMGNISVGNTVINNRPSWANIDNNRVNAINNRWSNQIGGLHNWSSNYPNRIGYWNNWGNNVRFRWNGHYNHNRWFAGDWWYSHPSGLCRWHYYHRFNYYPWVYWWQQPTWVTTNEWFSWNAPSSVWSEPIYYDYGSNGNVVYQNDSVYIGGQQVATADEFAESAAELATVTPPASDDQAEQAEWLPLGTFAVSTNEKDVEPTRVLQLAVDKTGILSGTMYNRQTDKADAIQGQVDKETQRVAFRIGEGEKVVAETGLYNLTQEDAPLLVHFGTDRTEQYNLVRLDAPSDGDPSSQDNSTSGK